jgi:hypothetical protein
MSDESPPSPTSEAHIQADLSHEEMTRATYTMVLKLFHENIPEQIKDLQLRVSALEAVLLRRSIPGPT